MNQLSDIIEQIQAFRQILEGVNKEKLHSVSYKSLKFSSYYIFERL